MTKRSAATAAIPDNDESLQHAQSSNAPARRPASAELDPEAMSRSIREAAKASRLSSHKSGNAIRSQFYMTPDAAKLYKLTGLAVSVLAQRPVAQATVLRLALYRLCHDVTAALDDQALAAEIRRDMSAARGTK